MIVRTPTWAAAACCAAAPGSRRFPVRLAREMFEQALALRPAGAPPPILYDPCCGAGHLLASVGLLYADRLTAVIGSDVDAEALALARENLRLLEAGGLERPRGGAGGAVPAQHGNLAHREALDSARALAAARAMPLPVRTFRRMRSIRWPFARGWASRRRPSFSSMLRTVGCRRGTAPRATGGRPSALLDTLGQVLSPGAVVAVATGKDVKFASDHFRRRRQLKLGKRRVSWWIREDSVAPDHNGGGHGNQPARSSDLSGGGFGGAALVARAGRGQARGRCGWA